MRSTLLVMASFLLMTSACVDRKFGDSAPASNAQSAVEQEWCGYIEKSGNKVSLNMEDGRGIRELQPEDGATTNTLLGFKEREKVCISAFWGESPVSVKSVSKIRTGKTVATEEQEWCGYIEKSGNKVSLNMEDGRGIRELQPEDGATTNTLLGFKQREKVCISAFWGESPVSVKSVSKIRK
ncbi:MAG: hypothetical protein RL189_674 [Pseudomonadota bacterium]